MADDDFPRGLFAAYADGELTRPQFIRRLCDWQAACGMDFRCRGVAGHGVVGVTYRGRNAVIDGDVLKWICDERRGPRGGRRYALHTARSIMEFMRKVDLDICAGLTEG